MRYIVLPIYSASEWNTVMQQAKEILDADGWVVVRQMADLNFTDGNFAATELHISHFTPAKHFVYDGQGHKIDFSFVNLLDLAKPGTSEKVYNWKPLPSSSSFSTFQSVFPGDEPYAYLKAKLSSTSAAVQVLSEPVFKCPSDTSSLAFSILVKSLGSSFSAKATLKFSNSSVAVTSSTSITSSWTLLSKSFSVPSNMLTSYLTVEIQPVDTTSYAFKFARPWIGFGNTTANSTNYVPAGLSLFGYLKNSEIRDVRLRWLNFGYTRNVGSHVGVLARGMENCTVHNVELEGCVTPYGASAGLLAGVAENVRIEFVRTRSCFVVRPGSYYSWPAARLDTAAYGGLFGTVVPDLEVTDSTVEVGFDTFGQLPAELLVCSGGLAGVLVNNGGQLKIRRSIFNPTFDQQTSQTINDSLIAAKF